MNSSVKVTVVRRAQAGAGDAWVRKIAAAALKGAGKFELTVVLTGDAEVKRLNGLYRGKNRTTDVLSFPVAGAWPVSGGAGSHLGDIVVSVPQARRQAAQAGRGLKDELAALLVHGCLHLMGFDHERPRDAGLMLPLQARILAKLGYD